MDYKAQIRKMLEYAGFEGFEFDEDLISRAESCLVDPISETDMDVYNEMLAELGTQI